MHSYPQLTHARVDRVCRQRLLPALYSTLAPVTIQRWEVDGDGEPVPAAHALGIRPLPGRSTPAYEPFTLGQPWGPAWSTTWFRITGSVPDDARTAELVLDPGWYEGMDGFHGEALVYRPDGTVVKGIHPNQSWVRLKGERTPSGLLNQDDSFELYVEAAANPLVYKPRVFAPNDLGEKHTAASFEPYRFRTAEVAEFHTEIWELLRDLETADGLARQLPDSEPRYWRLLEAVEHALDAFVESDPDSAAEARKRLAGVLSLPAHASAHIISAIGHAHIDSAWLWPVRETRRKVARTVGNVLSLMDQDDQFRYGMSSAQQYAWLQQDHPDLFARLSERVQQGRFIPLGGMWVETDCVMPAGESMVRQALKGQRYFMKTFGVECEGAWLPDSFGYAGGLPQIVRRAGFQWFLTQKIAWGDTNEFPHHSFDWEGVDGSRIFTHFPPANTYEATVEADELHRAQWNFRDKTHSSHSLLPFGYGDGGGGPTREMLARARRFADLEGAPRLRQVAPARFFADAEAEYRSAGKIPVWRGELYLELHRGTLTSQLAMKQGNRRAEASLRLVEHLAAAAAVRAGAQYPHQELAEIWQQVLLHQFHDVLPGSSIAWVHREARQSYGQLQDRLHSLAITALEALGAPHSEDWPALTPDSAGSWQDTAHDAADVTVKRTETGCLVLANSRLRVVVGSHGHVTSIVDAETGRELVPDGEPMGALWLFRDEPIRWDAWDVERHTLRLGHLVEGVSLVEVCSQDGAAAVTVSRQEGPSSFTMTYRLQPGAAELDMELEADWRHSEHLLKVALPLDLHTSSAKFETQYGYVKRDISDNTSWQEVQFEVNQHRWMHLGEGDFGVGITNDSSYGCDVTQLDSGGTLVRLSLLRAAQFPDPGADIGHHRIRWSVLPGGVPTTVDAAYRLNAPETEPEVSGLVVDPLVSLQLVAGAAAVDWVKAAEDCSGDLIVRIVEVAGGRAEAVLQLGPGLEAAEVAETDLLERTAEADGAFPEDLPYALADRAWQPAKGVAVSLRPFQLATLRLRRPGVEG
ncbi:alpha-mannosidase [Nesterenkonia ebinurensis]|uniref:alpha-mannosidase n=1 Tax=Nesterenkonia ebinurensis TaxID=2608252 RepID=UPI00123D4767|nr:alpha-mannosidase [Nesterenkonia ebinurensis]